MTSNVGKISGQMLRDDLLRNGVDLAFETDLIYLDVNSRKVGIKTATPSHDLTVNGTTRTTVLEVLNSATIDDIVIDNNQIYSTTGTLNLNPTVGGHVVYQNKLLVDDIQIEGNQIATVNSNADLNFTTSGTGKINLNGNTEVIGNLHATGTITADGNLQLGDSDTDSITFNADIASNIIPDIDNTFQLGDSLKRWKDIWVDTLHADAVVTGAITVAGIDIASTQGNIYYVATNGDDGNAGQHQNDPLSSIGRALDLATAGDTVYIYPGTYSEALPLTVPAGVTVKGAGIRSVTVQPDSDVTVDVFLLNGETTVEDLTITGFEYDVGTNTGYAFRFAPNMTVSTRSPYIRNVSVITAGSTVRLLTNPVDDPGGFLAGDAGKGAYVDGSVVNSASNKASMLFNSATFITPGVDAITMTNGVRVEWLNSFTYFANRGLYAVSGSTGFAGSGNTRLRIDTRVGTWAVGNTVRYYDTDGTTILASGVIDSIDGNYVTLTGKCIGFETITDRTPTTLYAQGGAALSTAQKKFGTASLALDGTGDYASITTQPDFAFPSTISRLAKTITVNGNAAVSATQSKFGGSSIAFDGTGDYLSIASDTDYGFGTGDFTIEGWFYKTVVATQYLFDTRTTLTENSVAVQSQGNGTLRLSVNGAFVLTSSNAHTNNAWNHLAISRASGVTRFFINGVVSTTTYTDTTNYGTTKPLVVGAQYNGTTAFAGYIDDFRVSNTARYTATFTPTTTAFVDDFNTKLLINGNSIIVDDASYGTATDFTIEGWIYPTVGSVFQTIFDFRSAAIEKAIFLGINTSNQIYLYVNGVITITTAATVSLSAWTHVALVRYNATTKIYINGTQSGSSWADITDYGTTKPLRIGADWTALYGFTGYIDDVKFSKGVARYTSNFTAPTAALTGDLATVLLLHFDGLNGSTTFLDDGVTLQDIRNITTGGTASIINFADYSEFGAEIRSISSANVYGNYGAYGDGDGVIAYLIGVNLAYIGSGRYSNNDPNDVIQANEVVELNRAHIYYTSVDARGDFRVGDFFVVDQETGTITFNPSSLEITSSTGITFTDGVNTTIVSPTKVETGNIRISGNTIQSLSGGITLTAASNQINLTSNTTISGTVDLQENFTVQGNTVIGDSPSDLLTINSRINSNIVPSVNAGYDLGSLTNSWRNVYLAQADIDNIRISGNVITTTTSNADLELRANGSGIVRILNDNLVVNQNLNVLGSTTLTNATISGTLNVGSLNVSSTVQSGTFTTDDIIIQGNVIRTSLSNSNLELRANGSGAVLFENLSVQGSTISGLVPGQDLEFTPSGTGVFRVNSDQALTLPIGTDGQRPLSPQSGMIRFNSSVNQFEGYTGAAWVQFGSVIDADRNTYVIPELSPGSNENTLYFVADGNLAATLDSNQFNVNKLLVDQIEIDGNIIRTTSSNTDLELRPNGTGAVVIDGFRITTNTITNTNVGAVTTLQSTGSGYFNIVGTNAVVIPSGNDFQRPGSPQLGMMRFSTSLGFVEIWDGASWISVAGTGSGISADQATEIAIAQVLIFG